MCYTAGYQRRGGPARGPQAPGRSLESTNIARMGMTGRGREVAVTSTSSLCAVWTLDDCGDGPVVFRLPG